MTHPDNGPVFFATPVPPLPRRVRNRGWARAQKRYTLLGVCEICDQHEATVRHHKNGDSLDNERANVLFVCRSCHTKLHPTNALKTICARGHPLQGPGADVYLSTTGARVCRVCRRENSHRYKARLRAAVEEAR